MTSFSASADDLNVAHVVMKKGQPAPHDGRLLTHDAIAKLIADRKAEIAKLQAELTAVRAGYEAKLKAAEETVSIKDKACLVQYENAAKQCFLEKEILTKAVDRTSQQCRRKWYESPWLPFVGGIVLCGGGVAAGAALK